MSRLKPATDPARNFPAHAPIPWSLRAQLNDLKDCWQGTHPSAKQQQADMVQFKIIPDTVIQHNRHFFETA